MILRQEQTGRNLVFWNYELGRSFGVILLFHRKSRMPASALLLKMQERKVQSILSSQNAGYFLSKVTANLLAELARLGAEADAARMFPAASLALIKRHGIHTFFANMRSDESLRPMLDWLRFVGQADLSLGRLFEGHVNALQLIGWYGTAAQKSKLIENLSSSKIYGVGATEPSPGVALTSDGELFALEGRKSFASGAGHIDFAIVTAKGDVPERSIVVVPANEPSRADCEGWQVRGMRATMSGTYDLTGLHVSHEDIIGNPGCYDSEPRFTAGAWRFLAVQLGGIEALLIEIRAAMSQVARGDPLQRLKFANAVEATRTAYFWVAESARMFERGDADAPSFVRMARGVVERAAMEVMADAARIVGTRSAFDGQRLDKIIRDLSLYLRQAGPDHARDQAALAWLDHDVAEEGMHLW